MDITVIPGSYLTAEHQLLWSDFQQINKALSSPFFCLEFISAVAAVRDNVWVGIIKEAGEIVGFFPFERGRFLPRGGPVGWGVSDCQGIISKPGFNCDLAQVIRSCGLKIWHYDNFIASQLGDRHLDDNQTNIIKSPIIDLSSGSQAYATKQRATSSWVQQTPRKMRKLEREVGELRFEAHVADTSVLKLLMRWKAQQYAQLGTFDRFQIEWIVKLIERIHGTQKESFAGMLSVLYAGDRVVALHFGMRSRSVWHWWFPTYDRELRHYSPGLMLLWKVIESTDNLSINTIDLGKGEEDFKPRVMNDTIQLAAGCVNIPSLMTTAKWLRNQPLKIISSLTA